MKDYFKYERGYVNIDDQNLFLTNTGNWSETKELNEKSPRSIRKNRFKEFKYYFFFLIIGALLLFFFFKSERFPIVGITGLAFAVYMYMKRETGKSYKIPLEKIIRIEIMNSSATIVFHNQANENDSEEISGIEIKGLDILSELKLHLKNL